MKKRTGKVREGRGLSFPLSSSEVDCCYYMFCWAMNSMSSHSCAPTHDPTMPPTSCRLSSSFPVLLEPGSLRRSFCTWPTPPGVLGLLSIMLNQPVSPVYRRIKTYYIKSFGKKKLKDARFVCFVFKSPSGSLSPWKLHTWTVQENSRETEMFQTITLDKIKQHQQIALTINYVLSKWNNPSIVTPSSWINDATLTG